MEITSIGGGGVRRLKIPFFSDYPLTASAWSAPSASACWQCESIARVVAWWVPEPKSAPGRDGARGWDDRHTSIVRHICTYCTIYFHTCIPMFVPWYACIYVQMYVVADGRPQQIYIHVRFEDTTDDRHMPTHTCLQCICAYHGLLSNLLRWVF